MSEKTWRKIRLAVYIIMAVVFLFMLDKELDKIEKPAQISPYTEQDW